MAVILAVNPGGVHNAALARLARELPGHELNGADSCAVAITAVDRRAPDLVLLPALLPAAEEAALLARLRTVPGGVRTLTLPSIAPDNPRAFADFARQVRESLAAPPGASPAKAEPRTHLIAAGTALAAWVRARRAIWTDGVAAGPLPEAPRQTVDLKAVPALRAVGEPESPLERLGIDRTTESEATEPAERPPAQQGAAVSRDWSAWREPIVRWLPRIAAVAAVVALAAAGIGYWPSLRGSLRSGVLALESGPAGSQVFIDGRLVGTTPMSIDLPAGRHSVEFRNGTMSRTSEVAVVARSRVIQRVDWMTTPPASPEPIFPGALVVFAPFEIEITEGNALMRPDDRGRTMLSAGRHTLRFRNRNLGYDERRTVEIAAGETATLNLTPQTTIGVTATEPSEVWIDGARVGQTPIAKLRINLGLRVILVKSGSGTEREITVTATAKPMQIDVDFSKPQG